MVVCGENSGDNVGVGAVLVIVSTVVSLVIPVTRVSDVMGERL